MGGTAWQPFKVFQKNTTNKWTGQGLERAKSEGKTLGRRKVTDDTMTAKIIELRTAKKSIRAIASEVGVSTATIQRELKKVAWQIRLILCQDFGRENIVYFQGCILGIFSTDFVSPMRPVEISELHHDWYLPRLRSCEWTNHFPWGRWFPSWWIVSG